MRPLEKSRKHLASLPFSLGHVQRKALGLGARISSLFDHQFSLIFRASLQHRRKKRQRHLALFLLFETYSAEGNKPSSRAVMRPILASTDGINFFTLSAHISARHCTCPKKARKTNSREVQSPRADSFGGWLQWRQELHVVAYRLEALQAPECVWCGVVEAGIVLGGGEAGNGVPRPGRLDLGRGSFLLSFPDGHLPSFSWLSAPPVRNRPLSPLSRLATLNHGVLPPRRRCLRLGWVGHRAAPSSLRIQRRSLFHSTPTPASSTISTPLSSRRGRASDGDGGISRRQRSRVCDTNGLTAMPALPRF